MKTKLIGLALTSVLSCGAVNAVTLTTTLISTLRITSDWSPLLLMVLPSI